MLTEKYEEYNQPLHICVVDFHKAFDTLELWAILKILRDAQIYFRYTNLIENMNRKLNRSPVKREVRQGDTMSPKLFTLAPENAFKQLDFGRKGVNMTGTF